MEYLERWRTLTEDPNFLQSIFDHIASGGSVIALCRTLDVKYASLLQWIHNSPEREEKYNLALSARKEWAIERVLQEVQLLGVVDIRKAYTAGGQLLPVEQMPDEIARAITSVDVSEDEDGNISSRIKLVDKLKALELLGKQVGMFVDRHELDLGKQTLEALVSGSMPPKIESPPIPAITPPVPVTTTAEPAPSEIPAHPRGIE